MGSDSSIMIAKGTKAGTEAGLNYVIEQTAQHLLNDATLDRFSGQVNMAMSNGWNNAEITGTMGNSQLPALEVTASKDYWDGMLFGVTEKAQMVDAQGNVTKVDDVRTSSMLDMAGIAIIGIPTFGALLPALPQDVARKVVSKDGTMTTTGECDVDQWTPTQRCYLNVTDAQGRKYQEQLWMRFDKDTLAPVKVDGQLRDTDGKPIGQFTIDFGEGENSSTSTAKVMAENAAPVTNSDNA